MTDPKIRIEIKPAGKDSRVWLDGHEISGILRGIQVGASVGGFSWARLDVAHPAVEIEGELGELLHNHTEEKE